MIQWLLGWFKRRRRQLMAVGISTLIVGFLLVIIGGYSFKWGWTGLNEYIGPNVQQYQPTKTLWDWLSLLSVLAIPVVVGLGAAWFTMQQGKVSDAENKDNQRETALQMYIDKMSELLLKENLRSKPDDEVQKIARVRTLTVLRSLDPGRKASVLSFLYESDLIYRNIDGGGIISLKGADFSMMDLSSANLSDDSRVSRRWMREHN